VFHRYCRDCRGRATSYRNEFFYDISRIWTACETAFQFGEHSGFAGVTASVIQVVKIKAHVVMGLRLNFDLMFEKSKHSAL
jgi:hypothetical protein